MANFVLLIAVIVGGASFVSFTANDLSAAGYGQQWASDACSSLPLVCEDPQAMAYVASGFAGLWLVMKFVAALRD